jgi:guanine deaminase
VLVLASYSRGDFIMKIIKGNIIQSISLKDISTIKDGGILLSDDGTVIDVLKSIPADNKIPVIDYGDKLIMQSFADMHLHAPQFPMLGMGMDLPLLEWLNTYTFKTEARFSNLDYARNVYSILAKELIDNGTTRVAMFSSLHKEASIVLMEELEKAGVTGYVGKVNMDRNSTPELNETTKESMDNTIRFLNESKKFKNIKPILTPRFTPSCTNELMQWLGELSNKENLYIQSHLSENLAEMDWVHALHPDTNRYWESYKKYGLWKSHTLMAHCVHSDKEERKALKDYDVYVVHCPDSNVNLSSGVCPVRTYLNEGVKVVLGSDIAGGAMLPMYRNIQQAIKISKIQGINTKGTDQFLSVNEAFYLATSAAQEYFGIDNGFAKGHKLHAIVVDDSSFCPSVRDLTLKERFERAVYMMEKQDIIAVYSEGQKVK